MTALLLGKRAETPFYVEKLNMHIWSREELSYIIYNYPLIALLSVPGAELFSWMKNELKMEEAAARLSDDLRSGESSENLLLYILSACGYYEKEEIRGFMERLKEIKRFPDHRLLWETGKLYYKAGRLELSEEKLKEALSAIKPLDRKEELYDDACSIICDLVAVRMLRFDREGALELLSQVLSAGRFKRALEYQYLITGEADLTKSEKDALTAKKLAAVKEAKLSGAAGEVREISGLKDDAFFEKAGELLRSWKDEYRKTG